MLQAMLTDWHQQTVAPSEHRIGVDYQRRGPAIVRNELCQSVGTEWLTFADDDDRFHPDHLATLTENSDGADLVWTLCDVVGDPMGWEPIHRCPPAWGQIPITVLLRTEWFHKVGGFPEDAANEDEALFARLAQAGAVFRCCHIRTWTYCFNGDNRSRAFLR